MVARVVQTAWETALMQRQYWRRVSGVAWRRTRDFTDRNGLVPGLIFAILAALFGTFAFGQDAQEKVILALVLAIVAFIAAMYVWNFVSTPPLLERDLANRHSTSLAERDARIEALESDVEELKRVPVPVLRFGKGHDSPAVLMHPGNPPTFQPFAWGAVANYKSQPDKGAVAEGARLELRVISLAGDVLVGPIP